VPYAVRMAIPRLGIGLPARRQRGAQNGEAFKVLDLPGPEGRTSRSRTTSSLSGNNFQLGR